MSLKQSTIKKVLNTETDKTIISSQVQTCTDSDSESFLWFPSLEAWLIVIASIINYTWWFLKLLNNTI